MVSMPKIFLIAFLLILFFNTASAKSLCNYGPDNNNLVDEQKYAGLILQNPAIKELENWKLLSHDIVPCFIDEKLYFTLTFEIPYNSLYSIKYFSILSLSYDKAGSIHLVSNDAPERVGYNDASSEEVDLGVLSYSNASDLLQINKKIEKIEKNQSISELLKLIKPVWGLIDNSGIKVLGNSGEIGWADEKYTLIVLQNQNLIRQVPALKKTYEILEGEILNPKPIEPIPANATYDDFFNLPLTFCEVQSTTYNYGLMPYASIEFEDLEKTIGVKIQLDCPGWEKTIGLKLNPDGTHSDASVLGGSSQSYPSLTKLPVPEQIEVLLPAPEQISNPSSNEGPLAPERIEDQIPESNSQKTEINYALISGIIIAVFFIAMACIIFVKRNSFKLK